MAFQDNSYLGAWASDPGAYKYIHAGTAAGTTLVATCPALIGYVQVNSGVVGTIVAYDTAGTAGTTAANVIGSVAITSLSGSTPLALPLWKHIATKTGLVITNSANLDLTIAALP